MHIRLLGQKMSKIVCPECLNEIDLGDKPHKVGDIVECPFCATLLEVTSVEMEGKVTVVIVEEDK